MYYLVKDSNGIEHCLQSNGSSYQDLITGEDHYFHLKRRLFVIIILKVKRH